MSADGTLTVAAFLCNALDEARIDAYGPGLPFLAARAYTVGEPRTLGLFVQKQF